MLGLVPDLRQPGFQLPDMILHTLDLLQQVADHINALQVQLQVAVQPAVPLQFLQLLIRNKTLLFDQRQGNEPVLL